MPDLLIFNRCTVDHADEAYARDNYKNDHIDITKWDQEEKTLRKQKETAVFLSRLVAGREMSKYILLNNFNFLSDNIINHWSNFEPYESM